MASVDEHVVVMQFDNKEFEKNVASTIAAIENLKKALKFPDQKAPTKVFDDISSASRNVKLDSMARAVDHVASRFTALGAVAFSVISNISNRVINAGIQLAKNLSLGQVITGFKEYELNLNSIQTILANTKADGTNLQDVNKALDQLNEYSDKTIYNFGQMARNIGTFTAAGVDLDTSVTAIKGIANLAAVSGSSAEQASNAMYQLSQALATGTLKLIDWNSVVNAGMGGEVFQKALFETGKAMGTLKKVKMDTTFEEWTAAGNNFRASLEQGWITGEVLTATLQGFTGDLTDAQLLSMGYTQEQVKQIQEFAVVAQDAATKVKTFSQLMGTVRESIGSGWSASFRIIVGDFEEARTMFTDFNDQIGEVVSRNADARNKILADWKAMGGRTVLIDSIKVAFQALGKIITVIKRAFHDIFPKMTGKRLYDLTLALYGLVYNLKLSRETLWEVRNIFQGFFAIFSIGFEVVSEFAKMIFRLFKDLAKGSDALGFFADIGKDLANLEKKLVDGGGIHDFFRNLEEQIRNFASFIAPALDKVKEVFKGLAGRIKDFFTGIDTGNILDRLKDLAGEIREVLSGIFSSGTANKIKGQFEEVMSIVDRIGNAFKDAWEFLKDLWKKIGEIAQGIWDKLSSIGQRIGEIFGDVDYDTILATINTGLFAGLVLIFKKWLGNAGGIGSISKGISDVLKELTETLKTMQTDLKANALLKIAGALALFAVSIVILAQIDPEASARGLAILASAFAILAGGLIILFKATGFGTGAIKLTLIATTLLILSAALVILAAAVKIFSTMSWEELAKGLAGAAVGLVLLAGALHLMPKNGLGSLFKGAALIGLAVALNILAGAVKLFATMSWEELAKGLGAIAVGLILMAGAMRIMPNGIGSVFKGLGLLELAIALNILAGAVALFATMSIESLAKGFGSIAVGLLIIAGAIHLMPNGAMMILQATGILMISVAMMALATAMKLLSTISWQGLAKGLTGVAGALLIMAGISHIMSGNILGAIAIGMMAGSLILLAVGITALSKLSIKQIAAALGVLAVTLGLFAGAALLLSSALPVMFALGAALLLLGVATLAFGFGMTLLASGLAVLATAGTAAVDTLVAVVIGLAEALPAVLVNLTEAIVLAVGVFLTELPNLIAKLDDSVKALIQLVIDNIPGFVEALVLFVEEGLAGLRDLFPDLVETGFALIMAFLTGVRDNMKEITITVGEIIVEFLKGLTAEMPKIIQAGVDLLIAMLKGVTDALPKVVDSVIALIAEFITQIGKQEHIDDVVEAIFNLFSNVLTSMGNQLGTIVEDILGFVKKFVGVLGDQLPEFIGDLANKLFTFIVDVLDQVGLTIKNNATKVGGAFGRLLANIVIGFISALSAFAGSFVSTLADAIYEKFMDAIWKVVDKFLPGHQGNPFKVLGHGIVNEVVAWTDDGFENAHHPPAMDDYMARIASMAGKIDNMLATSGIDYSPTITPVLDLTQIQKQASQLNDMIPNSLETSYATAALIAGSDSASRSSEDVTPVTKEISFTQINNSPESLSTAQIYRNTRSQITMAKEELAAL